jgi:hypothetical protein
MILVTPNPAGDYITIILGAINPTLKRGVDETSIQIYNTLGECVMLVETKNFSSLQRINVSHLPNGSYFVKILNFTEKFVVLR